MPSLPLPFHSPGRSRRSSTTPYIPIPTARAIVDCAVYVDGERLPGRFTHSGALAAAREHGGFVWLGLHDPDEAQMREVAATYRLHALAVEDAVQAHQRPKLERYDDILVMVMRTVGYQEHEMRSVSEIVQTGELLIFVSPEFVIAVRHGEHSALAQVRHDLESRPGRLRRGPGAVLHAIADRVVDTYIDVVQSVERDIEEMEQEIFTPRSTLPIESIYQLKREVVELRRAVLPLDMPLDMLVRNEELPLDPEIRRYLRDVADHHTAVSDRITDFDDSLSALINAALAKITVQQNTDMRKISAWVAIAAVPTMIAGIYGMNFEHMPELRSTWGYPLVLLFITVFCATLLVLFRRNHWL